MSKTKIKKKFFIDKRATVFLFAAVAIAAVAARIHQFSTNYDFSRGRIIEGGVMQNYPAIIIALGFILIAFFTVFGKSRNKAVDSCVLINPIRLRLDKLNKKFFPSFGVLLFVSAALYLYEMVAIMVSFFSKSEPHSLQGWLKIIVLVVLIINLVVIGINILKGVGINSENCVFLVSYPVVCILDIFEMIQKYQVVSINSELVYDLLAKTFAAFFIICCIRLFTGFEKRTTRVLTIIMAYFASIFALVATIPSYVMFFAIDYTKREGMIYPDATNIAVILVAFAIVSVFWSRYEYHAMPKLKLKQRKVWASALADSTAKLEMDTMEELGDK